MNDQIKELNEVWPPNEPIDNLKTWPEKIYLDAQNMSDGGIAEFNLGLVFVTEWYPEAERADDIEYIRADIAKERETKLIELAFARIWGDYEIDESYISAFYQAAGLEELK